MPGNDSETKLEITTIAGNYIEGTFEEKNGSMSR